MEKQICTELKAQINLLSGEDITAILRSHVGDFEPAALFCFYFSHTAGLAKHWRNTNFASLSKPMLMVQLSLFTKHIIQRESYRYAPMMHVRDLETVLLCEHNIHEHEISGSKCRPIATRQDLRHVRAYTFTRHVAQWVFAPHRIWHRNPKLERWALIYINTRSSVQKQKHRQLHSLINAGIRRDSPSKMHGWLQQVWQAHAKNALMILTL